MASTVGHFNVVTRLVNLRQIVRGLKIHFSCGSRAFFSNSGEIFNDKEKFKQPRAMSDSADVIRLNLTRKILNHDRFECTLRVLCIRFFALSGLTETDAEIASKLPCESAALLNFIPISFYS